MALALALCLPAAPAAASGWSDLAHELAAPWPGIQRPDGSLADYLDDVSDSYGGFPDTRYGNALMGYALLQTGLREGDRRIATAGRRALMFAMDPGRVWHRPSVFEQLAVAGAYNLTRGRPGFGRARARWARWLRGIRTVRLQYEDRYGNHWLVDAVTVLELRRSGLRSPRNSSIAGGGAAAARRRAVELINARIPKLFRGGRPWLLSDPPDSPVAYHGLSLGLYARAVALLGRSAAPAARRVLRQAVRSAALITAPNGDSGYFGRSQGQAWPLPGVAYGAELAARLGGLSRREQARAHGVAQRALDRLRTAYPIGPGGQLITPALATDLRAGARGLDAYSGAPSMAGLTLAQLNWLLELRPDEHARASLPADRRLERVVSQGPGRFAVVRRGAVWLAVRMTRSTNGPQARDLRYDAGLAHALTRGPDGWRELVPQRPRNGGGRPLSAGPVLLDGGGGHFHGDSIGVRGDGSVRVTGEFRRRAGRSRRASVVIRPLRCGVALALVARRGERFRASAFFSRRPRVSPSGATDGSQLVVPGADRIQAQLAPGTLASGERARLWRVDFRLRARTDRRIGLRFLGTGCT
ncbi:MAG TPA: hypothetical protein VEY49_10235 [Solirubrobacteraceae bacterium]|nr:hypothetical protein [Solirubrobacteraceae bacterium]